MRKINLDQLNETILKNRKAVNEQIAHTFSSSSRRKTTRTRSQGERDAFNQISIHKWKRAEKNGKIKKLGERVFYYDYKD